MKVNFISKGDIISIGEPIIMALDDMYNYDNLFDNMELDKFYIAGNKLIIENATDKLISYIERWTSLIRDPRTGECVYESIFNIKRKKVFEYMILVNDTTKESYICLPSSISYEDKIIKLEIGSLD